MSFRDTASAWIDARKHYTFDLVRIYLGIGLFLKGIQFIADREFLLETLQRSDTIEFKFRLIETFLVHYIAFTHLGGGLLLAAGLLTRLSAMFQIPILIGAVGLAYSGQGIFAHNQEFQFTALVLFLLILILIRGAGQLSVDHLLKGG